MLRSGSTLAASAALRNIAVSRRHCMTGGRCRLLRRSSGQLQAPAASAARPAWWSCSSSQRQRRAQLQSQGRGAVVPSARHPLPSTRRADLVTRRVPQTQSVPAATRPALLLRCNGACLAGYSASPVEHTGGHLECRMQAEQVGTHRLHAVRGEEHIGRSVSDSEWNIAATSAHDVESGPPCTWPVQA